LEGLLENVFHLQQTSLVVNFLVGIPGHDDNAQPGPNLFGFLNKRESIHFGHPDIDH